MRDGPWLAGVLRLHQGGVVERRLTGIIELVGAIALLIPRTRWWAGVMLAIYVIAVWPANFKHAFEHIEFTYLPDSWWYHAPRLALQPVIAWCTLFCAGVTGWPWGLENRS